MKGKTMSRTTKAHLKNKLETSRGNIRAVAAKQAFYMGTMFGISSTSGVLLYGHSQNAGIFAFAVMAVCFAIHRYNLSTFKPAPATDLAHPSDA